MSRICTVCARGGSTGVPEKNLRTIGGTSLVSRSVHTAIDSGLFDVVCVSSDDPRILDEGVTAGANLAIRRPANLADDLSPRVLSVRHAVQEAMSVLGRKFDVAVELPPTSPLRNAEDVRGAVALLEASEAQRVVTACEATRNPYYNLVELDSEGVPRTAKTPPSELTTRQAAPRCFDMNDAVYVWRVQDLLTDPRVLGAGTLLFEMPRTRSIDIDSELDLVVAEAVAGWLAAPPSESGG